MTDQLNERPPLELIALAAWVNCDPDMLPASMRAPTCEATMAAWKRVADALFVRFEQDTADRVRELEAENTRLRAAVEAALNWIDQDDCSQMGPAEDAAHTRMIRRLETALNRSNTDAADTPPASGLVEAVERFVADYDDNDRADAGCSALMEMHVRDFRAALTTAPPAPVNRLRRILKGWADWYRLATADDDNEYLNGKGWDDAEALEDMTLAALWDQSTSQENLK